VDLRGDVQVGTRGDKRSGDAEVISSPQTRNPRSHRPVRRSPEAGGAWIAKLVSRERKRAAAFHSAKQLGHSVVIAEKHYLGRIKSIPATAKTLEAAMQMIESVGARPAARRKTG
jgi:hypothetical protein